MTEPNLPPQPTAAVEWELAKRGLSVKEDFARHQHDPRDIAMGWSSPCTAVRNVCMHHLRHMEKVEAQTPDAQWLLFFEDLNSGQVGSLIRDATAN